MSQILMGELARYHNRLKSLEHLIENGIASSKKSTALPDRELDKTKAFVVLAYAETEEFVEACSLHLIGKIEGFVEELKSEIVKGKPVSNFKAADVIKKCTPLLVGGDKKKKEEIVAICSLKPVKDAKVANQAFALIISRLTDKRNEVRQNNGLNQRDLTKLFDRLGFETEDRFIDLRNDLDILTTKRSEFAHTGAGYLISAIKDLPDPVSVQKLVKQVAVHIEDFVNKLNSIS